MRALVTAVAVVMVLTTAMAMAVAASEGEAAGLTSQAQSGGGKRLSHALKRSAARLSALRQQSGTVTETGALARHQVACLFLHGAGERGFGRTPEVRNVRLYKPNGDPTYAPRSNGFLWRQCSGSDERSRSHPIDRADPSGAVRVARARRRRHRHCPQPPHRKDRQSHWPVSEHTAQHSRCISRHEVDR
jgi:hypothetical protein